METSPLQSARRAAALLALAALAAACGERGPRRPSFLLVTLDTTIPEALSCYGFVRGTTPVLDAVAAQGVRYTRARTVAPMTMPAHASMLTGLVPLRHSVRVNGSMVLPEEATTLAERARAAGYRTAAFLSAVVLDPEMGLDQGFEVYDAPETPASVSEHLAARRPAAETIDRALAWWRERGGEPFFLWVHLFDAHYPYEPPPAYARGGSPYYASVAYADHELGRLLAVLEADGALADALTIVVGDHGEGLGRHGEATHMAFAFDTTLLVPLLVRYPDRRGAGTVSDAVVSVVDVAPTACEVLGLAPPDAIDGVSLARPADPARGVYFETYYGHQAFGWSPLAGWADARGKYLHASRPSFYAVDRDPQESEDALATADVAPYRDAIARLAARPRLRQEGLGDAFGGLRGQIEKLGYVGLGGPPPEMPEPLAPGGGPSPHDEVERFAAFQRAQELSAQKRAAEAIELLRPLLAESPRHHKASFLLGLNLMELGRYDEAVAPLRQSIATRGRERNGAELNLALCYERVGRLDEAVAQYRAALAEDDGPQGALELFVALLERLGRDEEAEPYRQRIARRGG